MNTVRKGSGRPTAAAKRKTHAQRTPLPPRKGQVEEARESVQEAKKLAAGTRTAKKSQKPRATTRGTRTATPDTRSAGKAVDFASKVAELGWTVKTEHHGEVSEVSARRGEEIIWVSWEHGKLVNKSGAPMATYAMGSRTVVIRNASEALKLASRTAKQASAAQPKGGGFANPKAARSNQPARLPFDPKSALDEELISALIGAQVQWQNSISGGTEIAWVPQASTSVSIKPANEGDRIVNFRCPATGYRAFRVSALLKVSGGRNYKMPKQRKGK